MIVMSVTICKQEGITRSKRFDMQKMSYASSKNVPCLGLFLCCQIDISSGYHSSTIIIAVVKYFLD